MESRTVWASVGALDTASDCYNDTDSNYSYSTATATVLWYRLLSFPLGSFS